MRTPRAVRYVMVRRRRPLWRHGGLRRGDGDDAAVAPGDREPRRGCGPVRARRAPGAPGFGPEHSASPPRRRASSLLLLLSRSLARTCARFLSLSLSLRLSLSSQSCLLACSRPRALFLCARVCVSVCILSIWCAPDATRAAPPTVVCASGRVSPHLGQDRKEDGRDGGHAGAGA